MAIKIPVFLSAPTALSPAQKTHYEFVKLCLDAENLEGRALGRTDFPESSPIAEILYIARSCFGGMILGFEQTFVISGLSKRNTDNQIKNKKYATQWNQIEYGLLFALGKPLIVMQEKKVEGGIFDTGSSEHFLIELESTSNAEGIREGIRSWSSKARSKYRSI